MFYRVFEQLSHRTAESDCQLMNSSLPQLTSKGNTLKSFIIIKVVYTRGADCHKDKLSQVDLFDLKWPPSLSQGHQRSSGLM